MANPEHLAILKQGVKEWNRWRRESPERVPNSDLVVRPDLSSASLRLEDLRGGNLSGVDFRQCDLSNANLGDADVTGALFNAANLTNAHLNGADFSRAVFEGTLICHVHLRGVKGLEHVQHWGPSTVGIDTIYLNEGQIPESFLRGAGVPENFMTSMKALTGGTSAFQSVFIAHSTRDQGFADRLHGDLQARGVRCWFAPHDIQGGKRLHEQISGAIREYDRLLLILSEASMNSEWVKTEIANARQREIHEKRQMLFPISLVPFDKVRDWKAFDADTGKDSAREVREYFIPDFSNWTDRDSYQQAFQRLLRDLKAEGGAGKS